MDASKHTGKLLLEYNLIILLDLQLAVSRTLHNKHLQLASHQDSECEALNHFLHHTEGQLKQE